ncbi:MAG: hypothetical protein ABDI19_06545 [Armatimonadota bacterium]
MSVVIQAVVAAGAPALLAGVLWLLGGCLAPLTPYRWLLSPLAVGAGYVLAHILIVGAPSFPPADATHWLPYFALVGLVLGWLAEVPRDYRWLWSALTLLLLGWLMTLGLKPLIQSGYWQPTTGVTIIVALTLATWLLMVLGAPSGEVEQDAGLPFLLATLGGLSAGLIFYNKSASLGQLAGSLGATIGIGVPLGWLLREFRLGRGAVSLALMLMAFLWAMAYGYAELPTYALALLYVAGASLALSRWQWLASWHPIGRFALRLALLLLIAGIPLWQSYQAYMASASEYPY